MKSSGNGLTYEGEGRQRKQSGNLENRTVKVT